MTSVLIARCPEHGLHGQRDKCFVCGGPVEQVEMVAVTDPHATPIVARVVGLALLAGSLTLGAVAILLLRHVELGVRLAWLAALLGVIGGVCMGIAGRRQHPDHADRSGS